MARVAIRSGALLGYLARKSGTVRRSVTRPVQRLLPGKRNVMRRIGQAFARTEIQGVVAPSSSRRHYTRRSQGLQEMGYQVGRQRATIVHRTKVGGLVAGAGGALVGSHVAAYQVNKRRAARGQRRSAWAEGPFAAMGYQKGLKLRKRKKG